MQVYCVSVGDKKPELQEEETHVEGESIFIPPVEDKYGNVIGGVIPLDSWFDGCFYTQNETLAIHVLNALHRGKVFGKQEVEKQVRDHFAHQVDALLGQ